MSILNNESIFVRRKAAGSYVKGYYVEGSETIYSIKANIQPLTGQDLQILNELDRLRQGLKIYTSFALQTDDIVERPGSTLQYIVVNVMDYSRFNGIAHYESIAYLEEGQENE